MRRFLFWKQLNASEWCVKHVQAKKCIIDHNQRERRRRNNNHHFQFSFGLWPNHWTMRPHSNAELCPCISVKKQENTLAILLPMHLRNIHFWGVVLKKYAFAFTYFLDLSGWALHNCGEEQLLLQPTTDSSHFLRNAIYARSSESSST